MSPPPEQAGPVAPGHRTGRGPRRLSLAGQFLALQLVIVLVVLAAVLAISLAQSAQAFQRDEGRRALSAAENLAGISVVRHRLAGAKPQHGTVLPAVSESVRTISGSSYAILARADRTIITSPFPAQVGEKLPLGDSDVLTGRAWTGLITMDGTTSMAAHVPVLSDDGTMVGIAAVGRTYPSIWQRLGEAVPNLLTYLGVASVLGVAGSLLLSRRVKRQTLGMEPDEITGLVEHREAMLHGLKEGVIGLDVGARITLVNDSARELLSLPVDCVGHTLDGLGVAAALQRVLTEAQPGPDRLVLAGERVVAFNRMPMRSHERVIGSVTTLRDRTELSSLERQLGATRTATDTLRAQTHEFANQLHTISGLIQLEEYEEVLGFIDRVSLSKTRLYDDVTSRVLDPAVAALLIAKASLAAERGVILELDPDSALPRPDEEMSRDLTTVVGNLVDNALDAVSGDADAVVHVRVEDTSTQVTVTVHDSGPGVPEDRLTEVFGQGVSSKPAASGERGFGLALTQLACRRRGGEATVRNDRGAVFIARLPKVAVPTAQAPA